MSYTSKAAQPGLRRSARRRARNEVVFFTSIVALFFAYAAPSGAATYYVDAGQGNDGNPGTSQQPWKTMDKAQSTVGAGDTVRIRSGSYGSLAFTSSSPRGASWEAPITYVAEAGQTPTFSRISISGVARAWYLVFDGLTVSTGLVQDTTAISLKDASAVKVVRCHIVGSYVPYKYAGLPGHGVLFLSETSDHYNDVTVDQCEITGFTKGIALAGNAGSNIVFSNNTIYNMSGSGILLNAAGTRENKTIVVSGNHIYDQNPSVIRQDVFGQKSGDFQINEVVTQAQTGATATVVSQTADSIRIIPRSLTGFQTGSGKTITGQSSGKTLTAPTQVQYVEGEHGSGLEIRTRNLIVRNNIIHDYGNTRGIRCYPGHYDGQNGSPTGGYSNMLFENNLIYDTRNSNAVEFPESGQNFVFRNNTVVGQHRGQTGPYYYEGAMSLSTMSGVDGSSVVIANNILIGITGTPPAQAVVKGNVMYSLGGWQTGWKSANDFPDNIIVKTDSGSSRPNYFEGSGNFFVGGALFDQHSYTFPNTTHGKNLNEAYRLAAGAGAIGFAVAQHAPATDLTGNPRMGQPDAGCYEYLNSNSGNRAPVLRTIGSRSVNAGSLLTFTITADDADGDTLTYWATGLPSGATFTGQTFAWTPAAGQVGTYQVTFRVTDGSLSDSQTVTITVQQASQSSNSKPTLAEIGNKSVSENATLTFSVSATDPDGDPITYSATGLPSGASFSGRTFRWTPTYGQAGNYQVTFTASDGQNQDSATITITVVKVNRAPVLGEIDDRFIDQDQSVAFPLAASDPDGDSLTYSASGLPAGASLTGGSFSWTPSASQVGSHNITFVVSDGDLQDRQSVTIVVAGTGPDGTAPTVARRSPEPEAIQVSLNNLVTLHVTDAGRGVNPESVVIRVDDAIVYQGDVSAYESANGRCSRSGMPNDYRFIYQANEPFTFDHTVRVTVNAADRAGNVMSAHSYSFTTEMRAFGSNWAVSAGFGVSGPKSRPATVSNAAGTIWVVWCSGAEGQRDIYASRMPAGSDGFEAPVAITTASADQSHPRIAQDGNGTLYVVWQDKQRGNWDIFMAVSTDGVTWSRPIQVTDSDGNETYPAIAADTRSPSRVYIAWQDDRDGNADIFVASSVNAFSDSVTSRLTTDLADQLAPDIAVGPEDIAYVVWTDRRRGQADLYGARSGASDWSNTPLVITNSGQSNPAIAFCRDSSTLHLLWVDDAPGHKDIYHAAMDGWPAQPVTGESIIDDTSGADQLAPAIVSAAGSRIFACWQDRRHAGRRSADTDLFVAELGPDAAGTNIFVGDDRTNSGQSEPAIGIDGYDNPYLVWTDARGSNTEIYFAATTFLDPTPLDAKQVVASVGATVGTDPAAIAQPDDVSIVVPPRACRSDTRISISRILNPPVAPADCLGSYDFGPSGIDFAIPVTVTIPYRFSGTGGSAKPYWYDSLTGALTQHGITDIENLVVAPNLNALRFKTTHFTPFYVVADTSPLVEGDSGSGGGCSISTTGGGSPKDLLMPYAVVAIAIVALRRRDRRRRHSLETVHGQSSDA